MEAERDRLNVPKNELDEVRERQEYAVFASLRTATGEPVDINQLKHAVISGLDVAIEKVGSDKQALDAFKKARNIIYQIA
jgi:hypothetical protein